VAGELAVKLCYSTDHSQLCLHYVRLIAFKINGMKASFIDFMYVMLPKMFLFDQKYTSMVLLLLRFFEIRIADI
jgi:hypothetical protein